MTGVFGQGVGLAAALAAVVGLGLSGVGPWGAAQAQELPPPAVRVRQPPPRWTLRIEAPAPFDALLRQHLDIARFAEQDRLRREPGAASEVGGLDLQPVSRGELRRLVSGVPEQSRGMLDAEGYFAATVEVSTSEEEADSPIVVRVVVTPGPRTRVRQRDWQFEGDLALRAEAGKPDAVNLVQRLESQWTLPVGAVFTQSAWTGARNAALATLRSQGYPTAAWSGTAATVDASVQQARIFLVADSGPLFFFGPLTVLGLERQPESAVRNAMPFQAGQPYTEQQLLDFEERLQLLNLFDSVFVSMSQNASEAAAAPLEVRLRETRLQQATLGVGASSDTGPRVSLEHQHRLILGLPAQLRTRVQLGRDDSLLQTDLLTHPVRGGTRWFASAGLQRQLGVDSAVTESERLKFGLLDEGNRLERSTYAEYQHARVLSERDELLSQASAVQVTQQYTWRDVDNRALPTRGVVAQVQAGLGRSFSSLGEDGVYSRLHGRANWYRPLGGSWYGSARSELGYVIARDGVTLPDTLLFRAGGDESVRGYRFGSLGVDSQGVTLGGRALATASVEVARPLLASMPSLWGAVFVDAGDASDKWSTWSPKLGYGVGVRIRTPLGPIKLDVAQGQTLGGFRLHFNVGLSL